MAAEAIQSQLGGGSPQRAELSVLEPGHLPGTVSACMVEADTFSDDAMVVERLGEAIARGVRMYLGGSAPNAQRSPAAWSLASSVPWDNWFRIKARLAESRHFDVTRGAVTVEARGTWSGTPPLPTRPFRIYLWESVFGPDTNIGHHDFPSNGSRSSHTWSGLSNGEYYLEIWALNTGINTNPYIVLDGHVWVS